tara:strand:+ start:2345 stop:2737 length:393 start_codon:yes stop_codon:yes gene_type:complete
MSEEFKKIVSNLVLLESMDRLQYLLDLAKKNDSIPKELKTDDTRIWGCVSESYLVVNTVDSIVKISVDSDAKFVEGLLFLLKLYVDGKTKDEVLSIDEMELMNKIGMKNIVTSQRTNGFYAAIKKLKESV